MSNYDDLFNIQKRIVGRCKPLIESINISGLMSASEAFIEPMSNIAAFQYPLVLQESLANYANIIHVASGIFSRYYLESQ